MGEKAINSSSGIWYSIGLIVITTLINQTATYFQTNNNRGYEEQKEIKLSLEQKASYDWVKGELNNRDASMQRYWDSRLTALEHKQDKIYDYLLNQKR